MRPSLASLLGGTGGHDRGPSRFYECNYCQRQYDEWQSSCDECGQLVVRIVGSRSETER